MGATQDLRATTPVGPILDFNPLPRGVVTPICVRNSAHVLTSHPDRDTVLYIINGFTNGFDVGFRGHFTEPNTRPRNLLSARDNVFQVDEAIRKELTRGHTSGPFLLPPFGHTHCSPIGAAPKPDGSIRLIMDLSSPRGQAVNEGIDQEIFACKYTKFDDAVDIVRTLGRGASVGKVDIKHAFRLCPVRPDQWPLLCYRWRGFYFVDTRLSFGSRSSPAIFNTFADILAWIFCNIMAIAWIIHYLDDYFFANVTQEACARDLQAIKDICKFLGVPLAPEKIFEYFFQ